MSSDLALAANTCPVVAAAVRLAEWVGADGMRVTAKAGGRFVPLTSLMPRGRWVPTLGTDPRIDAAVTLALVTEHGNDGG